MARKKKPDLAIAVDFGGSGTKVFYGLPDGNVVGSFSIGPEVSEVPKSAIASFEGRKLGSGLPENEAWVGLDGEYAAVGNLAASELSGISRLAALKSEQAVWKFLAAVWVASKHQALGKKFKLIASGLLPGGEYADRERLAKSLSAALADFDTPDGKMEVSLLSFQCYPEGFGIYYGYRLRQMESLLSERIGFFMLGYRNASFLFSQGGRLASSAKQSDLGMVRMIEKVQERTAGLDASRLVAAVFEAGEGVERAPLWKVCRSSDSQRRGEEVARLQGAVEKAREEYVALLWNWIDEVLPNPVDRLVFSGGTVDYLRSEIESIYKFTPVEFHGGLVVPTHYCSAGLASRFVDVWAVFLGLLASLKDDYGVAFDLPSVKVASGS